MLDKEKQQNRGKQGWPDAGKGTGHGTECSRCGRDKRIPKLYSPANNMDPGPVPPQLQVTSLTTQPSIESIYSRILPGQSGGDAGVCCHANHVHLSTATRAV